MATMQEEVTLGALIDGLASCSTFLALQGSLPV